MIPGAAVRVVNSATGSLVRTLTSDPEGSFTAPLLPAGTYEVAVRAAGFAESKFPNIAVRITETTRMIATLRVKALEQIVEVTAQVASIQTTSAATGESVEASTIRNLPLATQNFQQLLTLSAGTATNLNAAASLGRGDVRIEVNGQREDNNNYLIEGISASDYNVAELTNTPLPSPDVVQEFKVQTSLYDATQGRNGGGNINAILKSGTKDFHFDVFEFFRNDQLNANEFFLNRQGQRKPVVKQNIFGGSAGGPVGRPGKFGYFFANYQGTRQPSGLSPGTFVSTIIPVIPSDRSPQSLANAFFNGDTTQLDPVVAKLLNIKSDQFGGAGGGWLIPSLPVDPAFSAGGGNGPTGQARLNISQPGKYTDDQFTANWDRDFRKGRDKVSSRFFFTNFKSVLPFGAGGLQASLGGGVSPSDLNFPYDLPVHDRFYSLTETHVFSPALVNELRLGYVRINNQAINEPIVKVGDLGINRPNNNVDQLIYKFTLANFQIGPTPPANQKLVQNNFTVLDTASYIRGPSQPALRRRDRPHRLGQRFPPSLQRRGFFRAGGRVHGFPELFARRAVFLLRRQRCFESPIPNQRLCLVRPG